MNAAVPPTSTYRRVFRLAVIGGLLAWFVVSGCSDEAPTETERPKTVNFELEDLEGETFKLSDQQGDVVLLQFFAVWCGTCQDETERLNALHEDLSDEGLVIVAIPVQSGSRENVRDFVDEYDVKYRVLYDENQIVARAYGVQQTPTTYIIDREGWIAESISRGLSEQQYRDLLEPLL